MRSSSIANDLKRTRHLSLADRATPAFAQASSIAKPVFRYAR